MLTLRGLEIINYQDKLYYIYRRFPKSQIKEGFINDVKDLWRCDMLLKKKNEDEIEKYSIIVGRKGFNYLLLSFDLIFIDLLIQLLLR